MRSLRETVCIVLPFGCLLQIWALLWTRNSQSRTHLYWVSARRFCKSTLSRKISSTQFTSCVDNFSSNWISRELMVSRHPPGPPPPRTIYSRRLLMPQLETLMVQFYSPHPNRDVDQTLIHGALPNLHVSLFRGVSACLECLARIRAPSLRILDVQFF
jgi:hypothetical protein